MKLGNNNLKPSHQVTEKKIKKPGREGRGHQQLWHSGVHGAWGEVSPFQQSKEKEKLQNM